MGGLGSQLATIHFLLFEVGHHAAIQGFGLAIQCLHFGFELGKPGLSQHFAVQPYQ
ncbi:hypothetical protein D3C78_967820 [compost metagenome]